MQTKTSLKIDWATHEAAKYACENWHYSKKIPVNKLLKIGVWENSKFIGVVIFGVGASAVLHKQFKLTQFEVCELVRVALTKHETKVSRIVAIALKFLKKSNRKIRVCVSFADPYQGHHGGIYQAGNWFYTGMSAGTREYFYNNDWRHVTDIYKRVPNEIVKKLKYREKPGKHRYVMPLDDEMRKRILPLSKPYPKRAGSIANDAPAFHVGEGGATPTSALHSESESDNGQTS